MPKMQETRGAWLLFTPTAESAPVLQFAAELGIERIIPVRPSSGSVQGLEDRMAHAAIATGTQRSRRASAPEYAPWSPLSDALAQVRATGRVVLVMNESRSDVSLVEACSGLSAAETALLVGPRHGFAERDQHVFDTLGDDLRHVSLGPRLVSPEAAAMAAVSVVHQIAGLTRAD